MIVFIILSSLLLSILSCKKVDNNFYNADYEEQFFKKTFPANEKVNAIIDLFKKDNEQTNFVNALPSNIGLPMWNKTANEKCTKPTNYLSRGIIVDGKKNFIIPFTNNNKTISAILFAFYRENGYKYFCYTNDYLFYLCYSNQVSLNDKEKALTLFMFMSNYAFGNTEFKGIPKLAFKNSENRPDGEDTKFLSIKPLKETLPDTLNITSDNYVIVCNTYRNVAECNCHAGEPCDWKEGCPTCIKEVCNSEFTGFGGGGDPNPPFPPAPGYNPNIDPGATGGGGGNNEPPRVPPCPGAAWYDSAQPIGGAGGCDPGNLGTNPPYTLGVYGSNIVNDFNEIYSHYDWKNFSIDTTGLNGHPCLKSIFDAITKSPSFYNTLKNFTGVNPTGRLKFSTNTLMGITDVARTLPSNARQLSNIEFSLGILSHSSKSFTVITFVHEMIHADFDRILMRMGNDTSIRNNYYQVIKALGGIRRPDLLDHEFMAQVYIPFLKTVFKEVDNLLGLGTHYILGTTTIEEEYYDALVWAGLQETEAFLNLPPLIRNKYNSILYRESTLGNGCN